MKDLKKIVKALVKESLLEILSEQFIEKTVKKVVRESSSKRSDSFDDAIQAATRVMSESKERKPKQTSKSNKDDMMKKILGNESLNPYADLFEDTLRHGNPILEGVSDEHDPERNELVSENILERNGLMRDYSKFI